MPGTVSASPPLGLKVEDEEGFQDILGHRPEVALGKDGEFVGGYHGLGSGIKVAGNISFGGFAGAPNQGMI